MRDEEPRTENRMIVKKLSVLDLRFPTSRDKVGSDSVHTDPDYSAIVHRNRAFVQRARELGLDVHTILGRSNPGVSYLEIAPVHGESGELARRLLATVLRRRLGGLDRALHQATTPSVATSISQYAGLLPFAS